MEFLSKQEVIERLAPFKLSVSTVQEVIAKGLEDEKSGAEVDWGGWDMVEGGEEVIRGDGWLKLNSAGHFEG